MHVVVLHFTVYCSCSPAVCTYVRTYVRKYHSVGIPVKVNVTLTDNNIIIINGISVTITLNWEEPFNNFDPIVNYTVSCSGNENCPSNFTTTDNTTRSHNITNLTPMTNYSFSVVATNSIGSGEAGVTMITTPPGKKLLYCGITITTYVYLHSVFY